MRNTFKFSFVKALFAAISICSSFSVKADLDADYGHGAARYLGYCYALNFVATKRCPNLYSDDPAVCIARIVELLPRNKRSQLITALGASTNDAIDTGVALGAAVHGKMMKSDRPNACSASGKFLSQALSAELNTLLRLASRYR